MKVLVIGATGFSGRRVAAGLAKRGHSVTCMARASSDRDVLDGVPVEFVAGDLDRPAGLVRALAGVDALMFVASLGFGHAPTVVDAMREAGVARGVFFSTTAIFTRLPARSRVVRLAAEDAIRDSGLDWTILRPTMIYGGPGDRNVERLLAAVARWPVLPAVAGGGRIIQPVLVDDLAAAAVRALETPGAVGRCYNLPGGEPVTFGEFVRAAAAAVGRRVT
ncbi:MAG: NAD(P)H-binding protein, partial [Planctomycetota bacterium]